MFFILPVGVDFRARRYPVVTFTLMGICVAVYLVSLALMMAGGKEVEVWILKNLWLTPAKSWWWTYLTSMFVHADILHLAGNMVYLFLFGACVEDILGRPRFIIFYLLCGLASDVAHIAVSADHFASMLPLGGASGAISGCIGGFVVLLAKTRIEFKWVFWFWFRIWTGEFMLPAWLVISFWFLEDFVMMLLTAMVDKAGGGVAFAAHVGGTVAGLAWVALEKFCLKRIPDPEEDEDEPVAPVRRPVVSVRSRPVAGPAVVETPTILLYVNGAQSGPFTLSQIQEMLASNTLPLDTVYWQQGMEDWRSAEELRLPGMG
jgi:membrane associated rhomboid family serine protease